MPRMPGVNPSINTQKKRFLCSPANRTIFFPLAFSKNLNKPNSSPPSSSVDIFFHEFCVVRVGLFLHQLQSHHFLEAQKHAICTTANFTMKLGVGLLQIIVWHLHAEFYASIRFLIRRKKHTLRRKINQKHLLLIQEQRNVLLIFTITEFNLQKKMGIYQICILFKIHFFFNIFSAKIFLLV